MFSNSPLNFSRVRFLFFILFHAVSEHWKKYLGENDEDVRRYLILGICIDKKIMAKILITLISAINQPEASYRQTVHYISYVIY